MHAMNISIASALTVNLLVAGPVAAQLASQLETLREHHSVFVSVLTPDTDDAIRRLGLVQESLEKYVLAELTKAKIPASLEFTDQTLILEIHVDVHKVLQAADQEVYAFISRFEAIQAARLAANRQAALAVTWRSTQFGAVTPQQAARLRDSVINNLNLFIRDWQAAQAPKNLAP